MKTIGLLGGMSWQSTMVYYRIINEAMARKLGGLHSARIVLYSVDFAEIEKMQRQDEWEAAGFRLAEAARNVERAGADFALICAITMHKVADAVQQAIRIPFVHAADVTADRIRQAGFDCAGLLGTRYTMEKDFFKQRLSAHGLRVLIPDEEDRKTVHGVILEELCQGKISTRSRELVVDMVERMAERGAKGIILGCTELSLLIRPGDLPVPVFDTTAIHAESAVEKALETEEVK